jgi:protein-disulfide isomerase
MVSTVNLIACRLVLTVLFLWGLNGCGRVDTPQIAQVGSDTVSLADFERFAGKDYFHRREAHYRFQQEKLDEYLNAVLLTKEAKRRNVAVETLLHEEVYSKVIPTSDGEISAFYQANKGRLGAELTIVRDQIREHLRSQKTDTQKTLFFKSLRANAKIVSYLKVPEPYRAELVTAGSPFLGNEHAPITIVKFEDFQCPFCKQAQPAFTSVLNRYDGKVRLVHKDLPLDSIHPAARQASEAARCAHEEGKFWTYHDKLYEHAPNHTINDLRSYAREVGLKQSSFEQCLTSGKYKVAVQKDVSEGVQLGINGTPTFFINGRELSGAQPVEAIVQIIDEELARAN